jgi:hypothetical protein
MNFVDTYLFSLGVDCNVEKLSTLFYFQPMVVIKVSLFQFCDVIKVTIIYKNDLLKFGD